MGKWAIMGLAVIAGLLAMATVAVLGKDWIGDRMNPETKTPRIMILTSTVLSEAAEINMQRVKEKAEERVADRLLKILEAREGSAAPPQSQAQAQPKAQLSAASAQAAQPSSDPDDLASQRSDSLSLVVQAMQESLDGKVSQDIDNSRRFTLVPSAQITEALIDFAKEHKRPPQSLYQFFTGGTGSAAQRTSAKDGKPGAEATSEVVASSETSGVVTQGIIEVGRKVKADYTLIVTIGTPRFAYDVLPATDSMPTRIHMTAQPEVNCEIFDTRTKRAYRFANQLAKPISETVVVDRNLPLKGQILAKVTRLDDRISDAASKQVLALVLDKVAPARIVQGGERMVINRGANDGVRDGMIYAVKREVGETIREESTGADLGRSLIDVGSIVVESAEAAKSTVAAADRGPFMKGDIVVMALPISPTERGRPTQAQRARTGETPNLAVDYIRLNGANSPGLGVSVSTALAAEPRIAVLPRAEMDKLRGEAAYNSRASGEYGVAAEEGMRQSGYLVSGECSTSSRRRNNTISIGGVSETVSTSVSTRATCTLRALAVDGRLIGAAEGGGGSVDAAAAAVSRALLARILPALGITPTAPAEPEPASTAAAAPPPRPAARPAARPQAARAAPKEPEIRF